MAKGIFEALDNALLWRTSRWVLNLTFGIYRRRFRLLRRWGVLEGSPSVLDIGCGIGHYAWITNGPYLGVDLNERYIRCASQIHRHTDRVFRCADVTRLWKEEKTYNLVLLVDFLHHVPEEAAVTILREAWRLSDGNVVSFEPVKQQTNFVGQQIIDNDRGNYMRPLTSLTGLFEKAGLPIDKSRELYLGPIRTQAILCRASRTKRLAVR